MSFPDQLVAFFVLSGSLFSFQWIGHLAYSRTREALAPCFYLWAAALIELYRLFYLGERG